MLRPLFDDLGARDFQADAPNPLWVADITQHKTEEGWLYVSVVIDAFARPVVGWSMADRMTSDLVVNALEMAMKNRDPEPGVVHHSDQGPQYTTLSFGKHLDRSGVLGGMGSVGSALANAMAQSFFACLQTELLDQRSRPTRDVLKTAIFDYIEIFYNRTRRHSRLNYVSPLDYEATNPARTSLGTARLQPVHQTG